jgi:hypothetical protein
LEFLCGHVLEERAPEEPLEVLRVQEETLGERALVLLGRGLDAVQEADETKREGEHWLHEEVVEEGVLVEGEDLSKVKLSSALTLSKEKRQRCRISENSGLSSTRNIT